MQDKLEPPDILILGIDEDGNDIWITYETAIRNRDKAND